MDPDRTNSEQLCPECGASLPDEKSCQDEFHQLLLWENQYPSFGAVHHLLVLGYHLQHPSLYSPAGLKYGLELLVDFLEKDLTPGEARRRGRDRLGSGQRAWKITGTPESHGLYPHPVNWSIRISDITAAGPPDYIANVKAWARGILSDLRASGNLPAGE